jgi:hypothetical protein
VFTTQREGAENCLQLHFAEAFDGPNKFPLASIAESRARAYYHNSHFYACGGMQAFLFQFAWQPSRKHGNLDRSSSSASQLFCPLRPQQQPALHQGLASKRVGVYVFVLLQPDPNLFTRLSSGEIAALVCAFSLFIWALGSNTIAAPLGPNIKINWHQTCERVERKRESLFEC